MVFKGLVAEVEMFSDLVRFRVAWWFKHHSRGSVEPVTVLVENLEICCDEVRKKRDKKGMEWELPVGENLKFNTDGSYLREQGRAGIGGVLRNSKGEVLCSFSEFVGNVEAATAELLAIQKAMVLCVSNLVVKESSIVFESDSRMAVNWILGGDFGNLEVLDVILDIRSMLRGFRNLSIGYVSRSANVMADSLAKRGSRMEGEFIEWMVS